MFSAFLDGRLQLRRRRLVWSYSYTVTVTDSQAGKSHTTHDTRQWQHTTEYRVAEAAVSHGDVFVSELPLLSPSVVNKVQDQNVAKQYLGVYWSIEAHTYFIITSSPLTDVSSLQDHIRLQNFHFHQKKANFSRQFTCISRENVTNPHRTVGFHWLLHIGNDIRDKVKVGVVWIFCMQVKIGTDRCTCAGNLANRTQMRSVELSRPTSLWMSYWKLWCHKTEHSDQFCCIIICWIMYVAFYIVYWHCPTCIICFKTHLNGYGVV